VVTGEGRFDMGSLEGKVVVGVAALVKQGTALLVVCGSIDDKRRNSSCVDTRRRRW